MVCVLIRSNGATLVPVYCPACKRIRCPNPGTIHHRIPTNMHIDLTEINPLVVVIRNSRVRIRKQQDKLWNSCIGIRNPFSIKSLTCT